MPRKRSKVLVIEGPNPLDLLEARGERNSLEQVCKLFGHDVASFLVRDEAELSQTLTFVGSISRHPGAGTEPLFIHISVHGNHRGIAVGPDTLSWEKLAALTVQMYADLDNYAGPVILVLSACGANEQELTDLLKAKRELLELVHPPEYVFVFTEETVQWTDAVVTWTIFYSQIGYIKFRVSSRKDIAKIQRLLGRLHNAGFGKLTYYRWHESDETYKRFDSERASALTGAKQRTQSAKR